MLVEDLKTRLEGVQYENGHLKKSAAKHQEEYQKLNSLYLRIKKETSVQIAYLNQQITKEDEEYMGLLDLTAKEKKRDDLSLKMSNDEVNRRNVSFQY